LINPHLPVPHEQIVIVWNLAARTQLTTATLAEAAKRSGDDSLPCPPAVNDLDK
jgi:hypothetical protein